VGTATTPKNPTDPKHEHGKKPNQNNTQPGGWNTKRPAGKPVVVGGGRNRGEKKKRTKPATGRRPKHPKNPKSTQLGRRPNLTYKKDVAWERKTQIPRSRKGKLLNQNSLQEKKNQTTKGKKNCPTF